jgi:hypothetical protein
MTEDKQKFVELWVRYGDAYKAASDLYPGEYGKCLEIANTWPLDVEILAAKIKYIDSHGVPMPIDDVGLVAELLEVARSAKYVDEKVKAYNLIAEITGAKKNNQKIELPITQSEPFRVVLAGDDVNI